MSPRALERCITPKTKAIITVDLYGGLPAMDEIEPIAKQAGIPIIEDAAQAVGAEYAGRRAGSLGIIGTFSFHGSKTLTTGEGGMFTTDDTSVYDRAAFMRDHGRPREAMSLFTAEEVGFKYKMSSLQAAFGLAQLERVEELITRKRDIFRWYHERLKDVPGLRLNSERPNTRNVYWMVTAVLDRSYGLDALTLQAKLSAEQIESRPFFHPLSAQAAFANFLDAPKARERNVIGNNISPRGINLPSALTLTEAHVDRVCSALLSILGRG
jgi:perosamine synthetase